MAEKKPIHWSLNNDPYYRSSVILADADVEYEEEFQGSSISERIARTLLKAVQDTFYQYTEKNSELSKIADAMTKKVYKRYRESYEARYLEKLNRMTEIPTKGGQDEIKKRVAEKLKQVNDDLIGLAKKEAWSITMRKFIDEDDLILRFYSKDITKVADIGDISSTLLHREIFAIKKKFHRWKEKIYSEEQGDFLIKEHEGALFYHTTLVQKGRGHLNEIEIHINREMLHLILFFKIAHLKYHLQNSIILRDAKTTLMYELLVKHISPKYAGKTVTVEKAKKYFKSSIKNTSAFKTKVWNEHLDRINKKLHTNIQTKDVRSGRKILGFQFQISKLDEQLLLGQCATSEFFPEDTIRSFGYYLALLDYFSGAIEKNEIGIVALDYNEKGVTSDAETRRKYKDHKENIECYEKLKKMEEEKEIPSGYALDKELLTLVHVSSGKPFANTAFGSLEKISLSKPKAKQVSLPGFEQASPEKSGLVIEDLIPFTFFPTSTQSVTIDKFNFGEFRIRITDAIKLNDEEAFTFDTKEKKRIFVRDILKRNDLVVQPIEKETVPVEVLPEDESPAVETVKNTPESKQTLAEEMHTMFKRINPKTRSGVAACARAIEEILQDDKGEAYTLDDIKMVMHWLEHVDTRAKKPFYSTIIKTDTQFKKNFEKLYAIAQDKGQSETDVHDYGVNILDALERI